MTYGLFGQVSSRISRELYVAEASEPMPEPPRFCRCGRSLVLHRDPDGFSVTTGERILVATWRCPLTLRWWNRLSLRFLTHDEYEPGYFGRAYWREREYR